MVAVTMVVTGALLLVLGILFLSSPPAWATWTTEEGMCNLPGTKAASRSSCRDAPDPLLASPAFGHIVQAILRETQVLEARLARPVAHGEVPRALARLRDLASQATDHATGENRSVMQGLHLFFASLEEEWEPGSALIALARLQAARRGLQNTYFPLEIIQADGGA